MTLDKRERSIAFPPPFSSPRQQQLEKGSLSLVSLTVPGISPLTSHISPLTTAYFHVQYES